MELHKILLKCIQNIEKSGIACQVWNKTMWGDWSCWEWDFNAILRQHVAHGHELDQWHIAEILEIDWHEKEPTHLNTEYMTRVAI